MKFHQLKKKKILILGFGREGQATLEVLHEELGVDAQITIADMNEQVNCPSGVHCQLGASYLENVDSFDVIIKTPGMAMNAKLEPVKERITSATQLFFDNLDGSNQVIGITGSKGTSTVSSLVYEVLKAGDHKVELIGNIGNPALKHVHEQNTLLVFELSSYQLEDLDARIHTAVFVSFFPDHLNYHGDLDEYFNAKSHIAKYQTNADMFLYDAKYERIGEVQTKALKIALGEKDTLWHDGNDFYQREEFLFHAKDIQLLGDHNLDNILFVLQIAKIYGVNLETVLLSVFRACLIG